ncbi:MAG: ABC transporter permease [Herpetosiphonaceae bacterium]|nr:MAG: ABC transporter permease [Herpetosiphonaceae bacterium]
MSTAEAARPFDRESVALLQRPPRSLWSDAWRRLKRNKMAIAGLVYIIFLAIVAIAAPVLAPHNPIRGNVREAGAYRQAAWLEDPNPKKSGTWEYPLGTDSVGRDIFSRLIYGTRVSLVVGFIPMIITTIIGTFVGLAAGFLGGTMDNVLMRFTDVVYAFPDLLFFIIMMTSLRETWIGNLWNGFLLLFVSLSIVTWVGVARLVRGQVLSLKEKEFVEAARAIGVRPWKIVTRHILPNTLGPIIVLGAFAVPRAIIAEAILSYLGIGVKPTTNPNAPFPTSWGDMILQGKVSMDSQPWMLIAPSIAIALITLAFTFLGDGLRDALDPREQI